MLEIRISKVYFDIMLYDTYYHIYIMIYMFIICQATICICVTTTCRGYLKVLFSYHVPFDRNNYYFVSQSFFCFFFFFTHLFSLALIFTFPDFLPFCLSLLFSAPSLYLSLSLSLSMVVSICRLLFCLSVCLFVYPSCCLSVILSVCLSNSVSLPFSLSLSVSVSISVSVFSLSLSLSLSLFLCLDKHHISRTEAPTSGQGGRKDAEVAVEAVARDLIAET